MSSSPRIVQNKMEASLILKKFELWAVSFFLSSQICPNIQVTSQNAPEAPVIKEKWSVNCNN